MNYPINLTNQDDINPSNSSFAAQINDSLINYLNYSHGLNNSLSHKNSSLSIGNMIAEEILDGFIKILSFNLSDEMFIDSVEILPKPLPIVDYNLLGKKAIS